MVQLLCRIFAFNCFAILNVNFSICTDNYLNNHYRKKVSMDDNNYSRITSQQCNRFKTRLRNYPDCNIIARILQAPFIQLCLLILTYIHTRQLLCTNRFIRQSVNVVRQSINVLTISLLHTIIHYSSTLIWYWSTNNLHKVWHTLSRVVPTITYPWYFACLVNHSSCR